MKKVQVICDVCQRELKENEPFDTIEIPTTIDLLSKHIATSELHMCREHSNAAIQLDLRRYLYELNQHVNQLLADVPQQAIGTARSR